MHHSTKPLHVIDSEGPHPNLLVNNATNLSLLAVDSYHLFGESVRQHARDLVPMDPTSLERPGLGVKPHVVNGISILHAIVKCHHLQLTLCRGIQHNTITWITRSSSLTLSSPMQHMMPRKTSSCAPVAITTHCHIALLYPAACQSMAVSDRHVYTILSFEFSLAIVLPKYHSS